jgi:hypothetical protein
MSYIISINEDDIARTDWYTVSFDIFGGFLFILRVVLDSMCVLWVEWKSIFKIIEFIMGVP